MADNVSGIVADVGTPVTRWQPPKFTIFNFDSPDDGQTNVDSDDLMKTRIFVSTGEEASFAIHNEEEIAHSIQKVIVNINEILNSLKSNRVRLQDSLENEGLDLLKVNYPQIFDEYARACHDPLDYTLPWPPLTPAVINRYREYVEKAIREVELLTDLTCRNGQLEVLRAAWEDYPKLPLDSAGAKAARAKMVDSVVNSTYESPSAIELTKQVESIVNEISAVPNYMPSYPEPYQRYNSNAGWPYPEISPNVQELMLQRRFMDATHQFLVDSQHVLDTKNFETKLNGESHEKITQQGTKI